MRTSPSHGLPRQATHRQLHMWLLLASTILLACSDSTSPGGIQVHFIAAPSGSSSFSLILQGRTYTGSAVQTVMLDPGTYEVSGSVIGGNLGTGLTIGFTGGGTTVGQGGVETNSIVSVAGPPSITLGCGIGYHLEQNTQFEFRFRFRVTADPARAC